VWGTRAGEHAAGPDAAGAGRAQPEIAPWRHETESVDPALVAQDWLTIRQTMWNYVGLVRTRKRLDRAANGLADLLVSIKKSVPGR